MSHCVSATLTPAMFCVLDLGGFFQRCGLTRTHTGSLLYNVQRFAMKDARAENDQL